MKQRLLRFCSWRVLLFFCALLQVGMLVCLGGVVRPMHYTTITAILYLLSLAAVLWVTFAGTQGNAKVLFAGLVLLNPLFGGMFCIVFGMFHRGRGGTPPTPQMLTLRQSDATYFAEGKDYFAALLSAVENAERLVYLEYYIFDDGVLWDTLFLALRDAAARGIRVDLVADGFGSADFVSRARLRTLAASGITVHRVRPMGPILSFAQRIRDHRKLAVIDEKIAFFGGYNVADEYVDLGHKFGRFKDSGCAVVGDAAVAASRMMHTAHSSVEFCTHGGTARPFSAASSSPLAGEMFCRLLRCARREVIITTPYFAPDDRLLSELLLTCRRGVAVTLLLPKKPDHPLVYRASLAYLRVLLTCGVRVYTYTPGFLHAKLMLVDEKTALVGSANWDIRSLSLNAENGVVLTAPDAVSAIAADLTKCVALSKEQFLTPRRRALRPISALLRFLAPLF